MCQESMGARLRKLEHGGSDLFLGQWKNGHVHRTGREIDFGRVIWHDVSCDCQISQ